MDKVFTGVYFVNLIDFDEFMDKEEMLMDMQENSKNFLII